MYWSERQRYKSIISTKKEKKKDLINKFINEKANIVQPPTSQII